MRPKRFQCHNKPQGNSAGRVSFVVAISVVPLFSATFAQAITLTFNGTAANTSSTQFITALSPYDEAGFRTTMNDTGNMFFMDNDFISPDILAFDDDVLEWDIAGASATFTQIGGAPFNAISFFGGAVNSSFTPGSLGFLGNINGGGTVSQSFVLTVGDHTQFTLTGFSSLDSLVVTHLGTGDGFPVIDDLVLEPASVSNVPEPSTLILAALGLLALTGRRRRK